jgi:hypothetical protein
LGGLLLDDEASEAPYAEIGEGFFAGVDDSDDTLEDYDEARGPDITLLAPGDTSVILKAYSVLLASRHPSDAWDDILAVATYEGVFDILKRFSPLRDITNDFMQQFMQRLRDHWDDVTYEEVESLDAEGAVALFRNTITLILEEFKLLFLH